MSVEYADKLASTFPFMKRKHGLEEQKNSGGIRDLYGAFGVETGAGWYQLIYDMCNEIETFYKTEDVTEDFIPVQIKEKFGKLRVYYNFSGQERKFYAIDFIGTRSIRFSSDDTSIHKEIHQIVRKYEKLSETTCEKCGLEGKLRTDFPYIQTLCENCYQEKREREICTNR